jgi:hypothetical protein
MTNFQNSPLVTELISIDGKVLDDAGIRNWGVYNTGEALRGFLCDLSLSNHVKALSTLPITVLEPFIDCTGFHSQQHNNIAPRGSWLWTITL